jgi:rapamycin-insensitive companion of mTOR
LKGFNYLNESSFIENEIGLWVSVKNASYLRELEIQLETAIVNEKWKQSKRSFDSESLFLTPHFLGELAKTEEGCKLLEKHKVVSTFLSQMEGGEESGRRSAVMGLCQIASCELGLNLIQKHSALSKIVNLLLSSSSLSMRAICFIGVGLISKTQKGEKSLKEFGLEKSQCSLLALPSNLFSTNSLFFSIKESNYLGAWSESPLYPFDSNTPPPHEDQKNYLPEEREVLRAIANLCNQITTDINTLKKLHSKNAKLFSSPKLLFAVFKILANYNFRSQIRKFILNLFPSVIVSLNDVTDLMYEKERKIEK